MSLVIKDANRFGPLTEQRLAAFESELGVTLPDEYRSFVLLNNGGVPLRGTFIAPGENGGERPFHCFFPIHDGPWDDSTPEGSQGFPLQAALADFRSEGGSEDLLPIGKDWGGSYVCLGLHPLQYGQISYLDHETMQWSTLASSLSGFLTALQ